MTSRSASNLINIYQLFYVLDVGLCSPTLRYVYER
jgi:hypothetical protein